MQYDDDAGLVVKEKWRENVHGLIGQILGSKETYHSVRKRERTESCCFVYRHMEDIQYSRTQDCDSAFSITGARHGAMMPHASLTPTHFRDEMNA